MGVTGTVPPPICRRGIGGPGGPGSTPTAIPELPESGIMLRLSTIENWPVTSLAHLDCLIENGHGVATGSMASAINCNWFMLFMTLDMPDEGTR